MTGMEGQSNGFAERFAKSAEARIEADKLRNVHDNAVDLVKNNVDFFGGYNDEKKSEIALRVLGRFGRGYKDIQTIINDTNNTSKNQRIAYGDLDSLAESVKIAMDMSVLGKDLVTDSMTAEQIDENLSIEFKGIGKTIKEKRLLDNIKNTLVEKNKVIEDGNLFTIQDKVVRSEVYKKWGEEVKTLPENHYVRKYVEVARSVFEDLGVEKNNKKENNSETETGPDLGFIDDNGPDDIPSDGPDKKGGLGVRWEISPEYAAEAMKFMDSGMRWQSYTPPEWMKKLDPETQARIEYMVMVNDGAASLIYAGKDLDKIQGNREWFAFDNEKFTKLFNADFKLVNSKMLHDLCELYIDKNGKDSLRYKEITTSDGSKKIDKDVMDKIVGIRDYKEEMADFLAKKNNRFKIYKEDDKGHKKGEFILNDKGEKVPDANYMDKMNAYTAWNLFFMFGDSSLADRTRALPTYGGIISDGMRTLNPEYKARNKWKIKDESKLFEAEYFGGSLADYSLKLMKTERDLGRPIDGNKTFRQKIFDGEIKIFDNKMCYGFYDFTYGTRDLFKLNGENFTKGENVTLSTLLMNYADFNDKGELISVRKENDFDFGKSQADFMNFYRDQVELAALSFNCMMGKIEVKNPESWAHTVKDKVGMVRGIKINDKETFKYTTSPNYWANIILGSFGTDLERLSSEHIRLKNTTGKAYSMFVNSFLTKTLALSSAEVDLREVMKYLGVSLKPNEKPDSFTASIRNETEWSKEKKRTESLIR